MLLGLFFLGMWLPFHYNGTWIMGGSVIFIGVWLLRYDMANVAARKDKQFKYIGIGLKVGYVWLILNGVILCFLELHPLFYDLYIHTFFLGFTFSMIWAHAPIMLPMVLGIQEKLFHPILWIGWSLFQLSLFGRIVSTLLNLPDWRVWFGIFNGWNVLGMFVLMGFILLIKVWTSGSRVRPVNSPNNELNDSVNKVTQDR